MYITRTWTDRGAVIVARGPRKLVLLHLSDIHLRKDVIESTQDLDDDIRTKLFHDVAQSDIPANIPFDAILVTGDIAFGGKEAEYESARQWLKKLCEKINCPESHVWVVPGNHDVDREVIDHSTIVCDLHTAIRSSSDPAYALSHRLVDNVAAQTLLSPFAEFNNFAKQFQSETTAESVYWESMDEEDDLALNDGSYLRLRGINSSLISDRTGDHGPPNGPPTEVVGLKQVQLRDEDPGVCYLTLCHHPPDWLLDGVDVTYHLNGRARIQLYAHEHRQKVSVANDSLMLGAGALHPNRGEANWEPRYNILCLEVIGQATNRKLRVEVYARVWKREDAQFGKDIDTGGTYPRVFELPLKSWISPQSPSTATTPVTKPKTTQTTYQTTATMTSSRDLMFKLFDLSYPTRMRILIDLHLIEEGDIGISDGELAKRAIRRAREKNQLLLLKTAIMAALKQED